MSLHFRVMSHELREMIGSNAFAHTPYLIPHTSRLKGAF